MIYNIPELILIFGIVSTLLAITFFDFHKKEIPHGATLILFLFVMIFGILSSGVSVYIFLKIIVIIFFVLWFVFLGILNPAYGKIFFICSIFSVFLGAEFLFFSNFFFLVFLYLIGNALLFYILFFLKKHNRAIFLHHYKQRTIQGIYKGIRSISIFLCIIILAMYGALLLRLLQTESHMVLSLYFDALDIRMIFLIIMSASIYFLAKFIFYFFNTYKNIHPGIGVIVMILPILIISKENPNILINTEGVFLIVYIMFFWIFLKLFLTGYVNVCHKTLVHYSKLLPGMIPDAQFIKSRFQIDIGDTHSLSVDDIGKIHSEMVKHLKKDVRFQGDILILKRFILTPFLFLAILLIIGNIQPMDYILRILRFSSFF